MMESKRKCKSENEANRSCKVMTGNKIQILGELRGGMNAAGVTFRRGFILMFDIPFKFYFNA